MNRRTMLKRVGASGAALIAMSGTSGAMPQCECKEGCCQDCPDWCIEAGCVYC